MAHVGTRASHTCKSTRALSSQKIVYQRTSLRPVISTRQGNELARGVTMQPLVPRPMALTRRRVGRGRLCAVCVAVQPFPATGERTMSIQMNYYACLGASERGELADAEAVQAACDARLMNPPTDGFTEQVGKVNRALCTLRLPAINTE